MFPTCTAWKGEPGTRLVGVHLSAAESAVLCSCPFKDPGKAALLPCAAALAARSGFWLLLKKGVEASTSCSTLIGDLQRTPT